MSITLDLGPALAPAQPRCPDAAWCVGHAAPGDDVHLSRAVVTHGVALWLKRLSDGPTVVARDTSRRIDLTPGQARDVVGVLVTLATHADLDNGARDIHADTGSEAGA